MSVTQASRLRVGNVGQAPSRVRFAEGDPFPALSGYLYTSLAPTSSVGHNDPMSTTLTIDPAGGLFLPPELLEKAHLSQGAKVEVDVSVAQIVVRPGCEELPAARLVEKEGRLVFTGTPPFDDDSVARAITADRDERTEQILGYRGERA